LFAGGTPAALPFLAAAFGLDGALYAPASSRRRMGLYALISLALFVLMVFFLYPQHYYVSGFNIYTGIAALALILSTVVLVALAAQGWVTGDNNAKPLDIRRIRLAQVLVVLFIIAGLLIQGSSALVMFYPACFAYLGTAAFNLIRRPEPDG